MSYELTIRKKDNNEKISKDEWINFVNSEIDFELISNSAARTEFNILSSETAVWKFSELSVPFSFNEKNGIVDITNPFPPIAHKVIEVAKKLNSIVTGEEGEIYDENNINDLFGM